MLHEKGRERWCGLKARDATDKEGGRERGVWQQHQLRDGAHFELVMSTRVSVSTRSLSWPSEMSMMTVSLSAQSEPSMKRVGLLSNL